MFRLYFFVAIFFTVFFSVFVCGLIFFFNNYGFFCCIVELLLIMFSCFLCFCFSVFLYFLYLYKLQRKCRCICSWCWRQHRRGWRITQRVLRRCLLYVILTRIIQYAIPWVWMWSGAQQGDCLAFWTTLYTV